MDNRIGQANASGSYLKLSSMQTSSAYKLYTTKDGKAYSILTAVITVKSGIVSISAVQSLIYQDPDFLVCKRYKAYHGTMVAISVIQQTVMPIYTMLQR